MRRFTLPAVPCWGFLPALTPAGAAEVPENYGQAIKWYEAAAAGGSERAQYNLALMIERGRGGVGAIQSGR